MAAEGTTVAIIDANPVYANGLARIMLDEGYTVSVIPSAQRYSAPEDGAVVILGGGLVGLSALVGSDRASVEPMKILQLVGADDPSTIAASIAAGATSVIRRDSSPRTIATALAATVAGSSVVPQSFVEHVSGIIPVDAPALVESDAVLLRLLCDGRTVRHMARQLAYSEREVHRRLRRLYRALGVSNRSEAIAAGVRLGMVERRLEGQSGER